MYHRVSPPEILDAATGTKNREELPLFPVKN
jgi:hypothetical protein